MSQIQLSVLLSLLAVAALAVAGRRPWAVEFRDRLRQTIAAMLFIAILAVAVFFPVTTFGAGESIDPDVIWFPMLLLGHVVLLLFLGLWWRLRGDVSVAAFLHLSRRNLPDKLRAGIAAGTIGWVITVMITAAVAAAAASTGRISEPAGVPPIMLWLAELPLAYKLTVVAAAMTVEEAFFRGFLQPRVGLVLSSTFFALGHFSYGLPFLVVGVFAISIVIGRTFERTGDLLPCIIAHGIFDGVQLLIVLPWVVRMMGTAGPV